MEFRFEPKPFCPSLLDVRDMNQQTQTTGGHRRQPEVVLLRVWTFIYRSTTGLSLRRIRVKQQIKPAVVAL